MTPEYITTLIEKLKNKTLLHKAIWNLSSGNDEYKLDFEVGAVTLDRWPIPENDNEVVELVILNEDGNKIDRVAYLESEITDFNNLAELHTMAKRSYYKADDTLKNIFKELESDKTIGSEQKPESLPF
jgi:hypothetical protein